MNLFLLCNLFFLFYLYCRVINNSLKSPQNKFNQEYNFNQRNYSIKTTKTVEKTEKDTNKKNKKDTKIKFH